jgi:hypothetical protein
VSDARVFYAVIDVLAVLVAIELLAVGRTNRFDAKKTSNRP